MYLVVSANCGEDFGDWWKLYPPTREFGEKLRYNGIKIFADGGTCGFHPAVSVPFYDEEPLIYGKLFLNRDRIAEWVAEAEATGHQVAIHAIGDAGVREAIEGIQLGVGAFSSPSRHRIEHNVVVPGDLIPRCSEIGIIPIVLSYLPLGWMDTKPGTCAGAPRREFYQLWEGNTRAMLDGNPGHPIAFHGDWPYVYLEPFRGLCNAVTRIRRTSSGNTCPPQDWQLNTVITVEEGLPISGGGRGCRLRRASRSLA